MNRARLTRLGRHTIAVAAALFLTAGTAAAHDRSTPIEIKPENAVAGQVHVGGFIFAITSRRSSNGYVVFHVVITEDRNRFNEAAPNTALGILTQGGNGSGTPLVLAPTRPVHAARAGHAATCDFSVSGAELNRPGMVLSFTNPVVEIVNGQRQVMASSNIYYARLALWAGR
jgi:hypothetical protein